LDFIEDALETGNSASFGIQRYHWSLFVFSNSSSKERASNSSIFTSTLSAVRSHRLDLHIPSSLAIKETLPSSTLIISYPRFFISLDNTASTPKLQGATSSIFDIINLPSVCLAFTFYTFYYTLFIIFRIFISKASAFLCGQYSNFLYK
jgi:hypothetical protein